MGPTARQIPMYTGVAPWRKPPNVTPLSLWLKAKGMSHYALARELKADPKSVYLWAANKRLPSLLYAMMIERVTEGGVPMVAWEGTALAKLTLRRMGFDWSGWFERKREEKARNEPRRRRAKT